MTIVQVAFFQLFTYPSLCDFQLVNTPHHIRKTPCLLFDTFSTFFMLFMKNVEKAQKSTKKPSPPLARVLSEAVKKYIAFKSI